MMHKANSSCEGVTLDDFTKLNQYGQPRDTVSLPIQRERYGSTLYQHQEDWLTAHQMEKELSVAIATCNHE
jgi:hypothetical protein